MLEFIFDFWLRFRPRGGGGKTSQLCRIVVVCPSNVFICKSATKGRIFVFLWNPICVKFQFLFLCLHRCVALEVVSVYISRKMSRRKWNELWFFIDLVFVTNLEEKKCLTCPKQIITHTSVCVLLLRFPINSKWNDVKFLSSFPSFHRNQTDIDSS